VKSGFRPVHPWASWPEVPFGDPFLFGFREQRINQKGKILIGKNILPQPGNETYAHTLLTNVPDAFAFYF
jgi:hypothetical protein